MHTTIRSRSTVTGSLLVDRGALAKALLLATSLSTFQLYFLPLAGTYFPLALFCALACLPFISTQTEDRGPLFLSATYAASLGLSIMWSPDLGAWANGMVYGFLFFIGFFGARSLGEPAQLARVLKVFLLLAALNAALVVLFRFLPQIEAAFWESGAMNLFKNPKRVVNLVFFRPNVLDPLKAGGVFDNANTGAAFNLLCLGVCISLRDWLPRASRLCLGLLFTAAVVASGSKSALLILIGMSAFCGYLSLQGMRDKLMRMFVVFGVLSAGIGAIWAGTLLGNTLVDSGFGQETLHTSTYRALLLQIAQKAFSEHPLTGLGFGGWGRYLQSYAFLYGLEDYWPPHNGVVLAWVEAGLIGAIALLSVIGILLLRLLRASIASLQPHAAIGALFGLASTCIMSLGDTFPLTGAQNAALPLGVLVAWGVLHRADRTTRRHATHPKDLA